MMRTLSTTIVFFFFLVFCIIFVHSRERSQGQLSIEVVLFRNFPNNKAWQDSIIQFATKTNDPTTVQQLSRGFLERKKINSSQLIFNLKGKKPFLWVYNKPQDKSIAIFATRSVDKVYKNLGVLLESWRDTLYVFDQLSIHIDSAVYHTETIAFKELEESNKRGTLIIDQTGSSIMMGHSHSSESGSYHRVELQCGDRTEQRVLHFFTEEEKKAIENSLREYLPFDYTINEYLSILRYEFASYRTIDQRSLENYIDKLKNR